MVALLKPCELSARETIHQLAAMHGITHQRAALDELGDAITKLSGDAVALDETEWLLVELGRRKCVDGRMQMALASAYQNEL